MIFSGNYLLCFVRQRKVFIRSGFNCGVKCGNNICGSPGDLSHGFKGTLCIIEHIADNVGTQILHRVYGLTGTADNAFFHVDQ